MRVKGLLSLFSALSTNRLFKVTKNLMKTFFLEVQQLCFTIALYCNVKQLA